MGIEILIRNVTLECKLKKSFEGKSQIGQFLHWDLIIQDIWQRFDIFKYLIVTIGIIPLVVLSGKRNRLDVASQKYCNRKKKKKFGKTCFRVDPFVGSQPNWTCNTRVCLQLGCKIWQVKTNLAKQVLLYNYFYQNFS